MAEMPPENNKPSETSGRFAKLLMKIFLIALLISSVLVCFFLFLIMYIAISDAENDALLVALIFASVGGLLGWFSYKAILLLKRLFLNPIGVSSVWKTVAPLVCMFLIGCLFVFWVLPMISGVDIEMSREGSTKGNAGAIRSALAIYYGDREGIWPSTLDPTHWDKYFISAYLEALPPVTATYSKSGVSPAGNDMSYLAADQIPRSPGKGWAYDSFYGRIYVNSNEKDKKGVSYTTY